MASGELLVIGEIYKYKNFEKVLKKIYDLLDFKVIFLGSSAISLDHSKADLSRRAFLYHMNGLSFREFVELKQKHLQKRWLFSYIFLAQYMDISCLRFYRYYYFFIIA